MQDFYPKAYDVVRKYFSPDDVKAGVGHESIQANAALGGGGHRSQGILCLCQLHARPPR